MKITVRKFTANDTKDWDDFVKRSNNGTLFHLRSFLSYHIDQFQRTIGSNNNYQKSISKNN